MLDRTCRLQRTPYPLQDLRDEYASFFDNFESERYLPDVQFIDPVTSFIGFDNYKKNLDMLGGRSALGNILFKVCHPPGRRPAPKHPHLRI